MLKCDALEHRAVVVVKHNLVQSDGSGPDLGDALKGSRHGMYPQHTIQSSLIEISSHQKEFRARFHYTHKSVSILKTPRRFKGGF